jgi:two-component system phosphate regulon response regulator PhoB
MEPTTPRILVVDDEPEINSLLALALRLQEYTVVQAYNGEQALEQLQKHSPDLILLDVMMPGMTGIDVARAVKKDPSKANIPIIFLTAKHDVGDHLQGLEMAADYVTKPFAPPDLLIRIKQVLLFSKMRQSVDQSVE